MAKELLPQAIEQRLADVVSMDIRAPEDAVLAETLAAFRRDDVEGDAERVSELLGEYQADGLAALGLEETLQALLHGQVEEVLIQGPSDKLDVEGVDSELLDQLPGDVSALQGQTLQMRLGAAIVRHAEKTGAEVRFIEKDERLAEHGGVGAFLRFRVD